MFRCERCSSLAKEINNLICSSLKRLARFKVLKEQLHPGSPGLEPLCPTHWTVHAPALNSTLNNYNVIIEDLDESSASCVETSLKAAGPLALMEKFSTYFGLKLSFLLFGAINIYSIAI